MSGGKGNQTMKFSQLVEDNKRIIFLEKSYTKCDGETIPRVFSKSIGSFYSLYSFFLF